MATPKLDGLVPDDLQVRSARILLESLEVQADIGFHEFESALRSGCWSRSRSGSTIRCRRRRRSAARVEL